MIRGVATINARTYVRTSKNLKRNILFIYLFDLFNCLLIDFLATYTRLIHMQEFSLIIATILRKENCVNIALFILI